MSFLFILSHLLIQSTAFPAYLCPPPLTSRYGYNGDTITLHTFTQENAGFCYSGTSPETCKLLLSPVPGFSLDSATGKLTFGPAGSYSLSVYLYGQDVIDAGKQVKFNALNLVAETTFSVYVKTFPNAVSPDDGSLMYECGNYYLKTFNLQVGTGTFIRTYSYQSGTGTTVDLSSLSIVSNTGGFAYTPPCDTTDSAVLNVVLDVVDDWNPSLTTSVSFGPFYPNIPPTVTLLQTQNHVYDDFGFSVRFQVSDLGSAATDLTLSLGSIPFTSGWAGNTLTLTWNMSPLVSGITQFTFQVTDSGNSNDPSNPRVSRRGKTVAFSLNYLGKFASVSLAGWVEYTESGNVAATPSISRKQVFNKFSVAACGPLRPIPLIGVLYATELELLQLYAVSCSSSPCALSCKYTVSDPDCLSGASTCSVTTTLLYDLIMPPYVLPFPPPFGYQGCPVTFQVMLSSPADAASDVSISPDLGITMGMDLSHFTVTMATLPISPGTASPLYQVTYTGPRRSDALSFSIWIQSDPDTPPSLSVPTALTLVRGTSFTLDLNAAVEDNNQLSSSLSIVITIPTKPSGYSTWLSESAGVVTWVAPELGPSSIVITVDVTDNCAHTVTQYVALTVESAVQLTIPAFFRVTLGETLSIHMQNYLLIDGASPAPASYTISSSGLMGEPSNAASGVMNIDGADLGLVTWTPTAQAGASGLVTYWLKINGVMAEGTFTVLVDHSVYIKPMRKYETFAVVGTTWSYTYLLHDLDQGDSHSCVFSATPTPAVYTGSLPTPTTADNLSVFWLVVASDGANSLVSVQASLSCKDQSGGWMSAMPVTYTVDITVIQKCAFDSIATQQAFVGYQWTVNVNVIPILSASTLQVQITSTHELTFSQDITTLGVSSAVVSLSWTPESTHLGHTYSVALTCSDSSIPSLISASQTVSFNLKVVAATSPTISIPSYPNIPILMTPGVDWKVTVSITSDPWALPVASYLYITDSSITGLTLDPDTDLTRVLTWTSAGMSVWGSRYTGAVLIQVLNNLGLGTQLELNLYPNDICVIAPVPTLKFPYNCAPQTVPLSVTDTQSLVWTVTAIGTNFPGTETVSDSGLVTLTFPVTDPTPGSLPDYYTIIISAQDTHPIIPASCTMTLHIEVSSINQAPSITCPSSIADLNMSVLAPWNYVLDPGTSNSDLDEDDSTLTFEVAIFPVPSVVPTIQKVSAAFKTVSLYWSSPTYYYPSYTLTLRVTDLWGIMTTCNSIFKPNFPTTCDTTASPPQAFEGQPWIWQLPLSDKNNRIEDVTVTLTSSPGLSLALSQYKEVSWLPPDIGSASAVVSYTFTAQYQDPGNTLWVSSCTFQVQLIEKNNSPELVLSSPVNTIYPRPQIVVSSGLTEGQAFSLVFQVKDVDDINYIEVKLVSAADPRFTIDSLTYTSVSSTIREFTLIWTPQNLMYSSGLVTLQAYDTTDVSSFQLFDVIFNNIQQVNNPPVLQPITGPPASYLDSDRYSADLIWYDIDSYFEDVTASVYFVDASGVEVTTDSIGLGIILLGKSAVVRQPAYITHKITGAFRVQMCDASGACSIKQEVTMTIDHMNQLPVFLPSVQSMGLSVGASPVLTLAATDFEGDSVFYCVNSSPTDPSDGVVSLSGNQVTWSGMLYKSFYSEIFTAEVSDRATSCTDAPSLFTSLNLMFCKDFACNGYPQLKDISFDSGLSVLTVHLQEVTSITEVYLGGVLTTCSAGLQCTVSSELSEALPVVVKNAAGYSIPVTDIVTYSTPVITSVSPSVIYSNRYTELLLSGSNLHHDIQCYCTQSGLSDTELYIDWISSTLVRCITGLLTSGSGMFIKLVQGTKSALSSLITVCDEPVFQSPRTYSGHSLGSYSMILNVDLKCWKTGSVVVLFGGYTIVSVPPSDIDEIHKQITVRIPPRFDFRSDTVVLSISTTLPIYEWAGSQAQLTYVSTCLNPGNLCGSVSAIVQCPAGQVCSTADSSRVTPTPCPAGFYMPNQGGDTCLPCPLGSMCDNEGLSTPDLCEAGWICDKSGIDWPNVMCPVGYYCPAGTDGRFITTVTPYLTYEAYFPTVTGDQQPSDHWMGRGQGFDSTRSDYYGSAAHSFVVQNFCPGYYPVPAVTAGIALNQPLPCSDGSYCAEAVIASTPDNSNQLAPRDCNQGYVCVSGDGESFDTRRLCTAGNYCPGTSTTSVDCTTSPSSCRKCQCPPGSSCPLNGMNAPTLCSKGTYQDSCSMITCAQCPAGYYCDMEGITSIADMPLCPPGNDCPLGSVNPIPCSVGTYKILSGSSCQACAVGFLCPEQGMTAPVLCPAGQMCLNLGQSTGADCPAGMYCPPGTNLNVSPCPSSDVGQPCFECEKIDPACKCPTCPISCPAGSMCPQGSGSPILCAPGSYQAQAGQSSCSPCTAGWFCPSSGLTSMTVCTPGYYCDQDSLVQPTALCPNGMICLEGTKYASPQSTRRELTTGPIRDCLSFNSALKSGSPLYCPTGMYCMPGTYTSALGSGGPVSCEAGTFNQICGQGACNACPIGYSCAAGTVDPALCSLGTYSSGRSNICNPCPSGTWGGTMMGKTSPSECPPCPAGRVCAGQGISSLSGMSLCKPGFYCPEGTSVEANLCPAGCYCPAGTASLSDAKTRVCPAGRYCAEGTSAGSTDAAQCVSSLATCLIGKICPQNYFCPAGTDENYIACPKDTISPSGSTAITNCHTDPKVTAKVYNSINTLYVNPTGQVNYTNDGMSVFPFYSYTFSFDRTKFLSAVFLFDYILVIEILDGSKTVRIPFVDSFSYTPKEEIPLNSQLLNSTESVMQFSMVVHVTGTVKFIIEVLSGFYSYQSFQSSFQNSVSLLTVTQADRKPGYSFLAVLSRDSKSTFYEPINSGIVHTLGTDPSVYSTFNPTLIQQTVINTLRSLPDSDLTFVPQTVISLWDQFPDSTHLYPFDYLPYISDCDQYGTYLPIYMLVNHPKCTFVAEENTVPMDILKPLTRPNGDSCDLNLTCHFSEDFASSADSTLEFWVEAFDLSPYPVLYFTRPQLTGSVYSSGIPSATDTSNSFDSQFYSSGDLIKVVASRGSASYVKGMIPRKVKLELGYFQSTRVDKEILSATLTFSDFDSHPEDKKYTFEFSLQPLGWLQCLDSFGFAEFLYYIFVFLLCLIIFGTIVLFWALNFSFSKVLPRPKLKVSLYLHYSGRALIGIFLAVLPICTVIALVWFPLTSLTSLQTITGNYAYTEPIDPSSISDLDRVTEYRNGRFGTALCCIGWYLIMWGTTALFPPISVSDSSHPKDLAERTLKVKRLRGLFCWNLIPVLLFSLATFQFAKSEVFATYSTLFIAVFKITNNVIVVVNRGMMKDDLYVLPLYGGMSLVTMLITIKVGAFTQFLTGYLTQVFIKIAKRTFIEPYQLTIKDWVAHMKAKCKLSRNSDPEDDLSFKDRVYIEQINSLGQNSVEFIAAWLFPVLVVFNYFYHEELKTTIAKDFLKYFIVFSFTQACAEVSFDVFLNNAIESRTGRLLSVKIFELSRVFTQRKCLWALSDGTILPGKRLLPSTENLQRMGLGTQHFLVMTTIMFGLASQVYAFELWVTWGYSPFRDYLTVGIIPVVVGVCFVLDYGLKFIGRKMKIWTVKSDSEKQTSTEDFYEELKTYIMQELQEHARRTRKKTAEIALAKMVLNRVLSEKEDKRQVTASIKLLKTIQSAVHEKEKREKEEGQTAVELSILPVLKDEEKVLTIHRKVENPESYSRLEGSWPELFLYPWEATGPETTLNR